MQIKLIGQYYVGFNREAFKKQKLIKDIDYKSNAYKSGLRNNQRVLGYDVPKGFGYPDQIITIKTTDGEHKFVPEHHTKTLQIFQIKKNMCQEEKELFDRFF